LDGSKWLSTHNAFAVDPDAKHQVGRFKMAINAQAKTARSVSQDTTDNFIDLFHLSHLVPQQIG
jgi:LDH2 family malate/lactate/ureidoglycolate dehydrogenase